jgi:FlgN protein
MDSKSKELSEFCGVLWREREIVERVLFKIVIQQLVLNTGQTRWLTQANTEIELAVNDLRVVEVVRNAESDALAARLGLAPGASLAELSAVAPEPWGSILAEHRDALRELTAEIERTAQENRELIAAGGARAGQAPA